MNMETKYYYRVDDTAPNHTLHLADGFRVGYRKAPFDQEVDFNNPATLIPLFEAALQRERLEGRQPHRDVYAYTVKLSTGVEFTLGKGNRTYTIAHGDTIDAIPINNRVPRQTYTQVNTLPVMNAEVKTPIVTRYREAMLKTHHNAEDITAIVKWLIDDSGDSLLNSLARKLIAAVYDEDWIIDELILLLCNLNKPSKVADIRMMLYSSIHTEDQLIYVLGIFGVDTNSLNINLS